MKASLPGREGFILHLLHFKGLAGLAQGIPLLRSDVGT